MAGEREELEQEIRGHCQTGDVRSAAAAAIRGYGPEIFGFLVAFHRRDDDAAEVFSRFSEHLVRGITGFAWHCSFRTWAYAVARNASITYRRQARRHAAAHVPLPSQLSAIEQPERTDTLSYLRTQRKARIHALRDSLSPEDQELLVLRVDKRLPYNDLVRVLHEHDGPLTDEFVKREAARLRKRLQLIKDKLHDLGRREGLLRDGGQSD